MSLPASPCGSAEFLSPFTLITEGIDVALRVTPKALRNAIGQVVADGQGCGVLKVAVTAVPENGAANTAVIKHIAKSWRLRKSDMEIVRGATGRSKTLRIKGAGEDELRRLEAAIR